jgi:hypothetical protein
MSSQYLKTIEDMGGIPDRFYEFNNPLNYRFWTITFGVFLPYTNWKQGDLITNQKLVGYLTVRRYGDLIYYPQILGHGEHLECGIMALMHFEVIKILNSTLSKYSDGVKVLMYTAMNTPSLGLSTWKKRAGFKPIQITLTHY